MKSVEPNGMHWLVLVEGILTVDGLPADDQEKEIVAAFLRDPFTLKVLVSGGSVLKHEWIGVILS